MSQPKSIQLCSYLLDIVLFLCLWKCLCLCPKQDRRNTLGSPNPYIKGSIHSLLSSFKNFFLSFIVMDYNEFLLFVIYCLIGKYTRIEKIYKIQRNCCKGEKNSFRLFFIFFGFSGILSYWIWWSPVSFSSDLAESCLLRVVPQDILKSNPRLILEELSRFNGRLNVTKDKRLSSAHLY